jgi:hypothetical protein
MDDYGEAVDFFAAGLPESAHMVRFERSQSRFPTLNDTSLAHEIVVGVQGSLVVLAPVVGIWISKKKRVTLSVGKRKVELHNYSADDVKDILESWDRLA